jgi:hypothetical protein
MASNCNISVDTTPLEIIQQSIFLGLVVFFLVISYETVLVF